MTPSEFYRIVSREYLQQQVFAAQTPAYLFFEPVIRSRVAQMRRALGPRFDVNYAMKANPHADVLKLARELDLGVDVASGGELRAALDAGVDKRRIEFSGPGKTSSELKLALDSRIGCINVESLGEIELLRSLASSMRDNLPVRVGIRLNPDIDVRAGLRMGSAPQFGVPTQDREQAVEQLLGNPDMDFVGLSMHIGSQILEADAVVSIFEAGLDLATLITGQIGRPLKKLNFGGGWGVNYFDGQAPLDLDSVAEGIGELLARPEYAALEQTSFLVEPGRFLVAESGVYATRVLYRKRAGETEIVVVDGGLNSNYVLAGGMGQVIRRNFQLEVFGEGEVRAPAPKRLFTIAGCLCTPQDILAQNLELEHDVVPGDCIVFFNCGAYGASASPSRFLSHGDVSELVVGTGDTVRA